MATVSILTDRQRDVLRLLAHVYLKHGKPARAASLLLALHALEPGNSMVTKSLVCALLRMKRPKDALPLLDHLMSRGDVSALTHLFRAQALAMMGRLPEASRSMRYFVETKAQQPKGEKK